MSILKIQGRLKEMYKDYWMKASEVKKKIVTL